MRRPAIALALLLLAAVPAASSESGTELATGGLLFVHHESLEILGQDLTISPQGINIRYRLLNRSDRDFAALVSFPMPDIHIEGPDETVSLPGDDGVNLLAFTAVVNGNDITPAVEQRALAAGLDRTELLRRLGIPLAPHLVATGEALDRLTPEQWEDLRRIAIAETEQYDSGRGMRKHLAPRWILQTTYYWEQTFAAKAETVIELRYKPSVGVSAQTLLGSPEQSKEPWYDEYREKYCLNFEFLAAVERERKAANSKTGAPFAEKRIEYTLRTSAAGSSPVKEFRLVVDKGAPENLASFCGEEASKISDTQVELKNSDYLPDGSLPVIFLQKVAQ